MPSSTIVASLDVVERILETPVWNNRAKKVRTMKELRQLILEFCVDNGIVVETDGEMLCT